MKMGKHSWLMMNGCAIPAVGIVLLPLPGVKLGKGHDSSGHGGDGSKEEGMPPCHEESAPIAAPAPRALPSPSEKD